MKCINVCFKSKIFNGSKVTLLTVRSVCEAFLKAFTDVLMCL